MPPSIKQRLLQQQRPEGFVVMKQRWAGLGFFHWDLDPQVIQARLPKGLHVDTFEGRAWIGVVPFFMQRVRPVCLPPVPWLSWFDELNVRTYVHDDHGTPGVWFFSLDCNQALAVEIARRAFHLPYQHAKMNAIDDGNRIDYEAQRRSETSGVARFEYPHPLHPRPAREGTLEWFLVERYTLFAADPRGQLYSGRVHHAPYQIETMPQAECSTLPLGWNGFAVPNQPPVSMLSAAPVDVNIFPLKRLPRV